MPGTKKVPPTSKEALDTGRKVLSVAFGALETAGTRVATFAHEGKKRFAIHERKPVHKGKAS